MGVTFLFLAGLAGLIGAAFSKVLAEEFRAWAPFIARATVALAIRQLPAEDQDRFREEWLADMADIPGDLGKLFWAAGCFRAATAISRPRLLQFALKRIFDVVVSGLALIALLPMLVAVALLIVIEDRGPILVTEIRWGKGGKKIQVVKFRTVGHLPSDLEKDGLITTRIGEFLRRTSLGDLPQLWNIFKGDMSLVGPRTRPVNVGNEQQNGISDAATKNSEHHKVRPGISGLHRLNGRNGRLHDRESAEKRIEMEYVQNYSFWLDIKITLKLLDWGLVGEHPSMFERLKIYGLIGFIMCVPYLVVIGSAML